MRNVADLDWNDIILINNLLPEIQIDRSVWKVQIYKFHNK